MKEILPATLQSLHGRTATWWEVVLCLMALAGGVDVLRIIAGRIFAAGIMLYGKEPSWIEIVRWIRAH